MRFFRLPKIFLFFASIFSRKNTENHGFWPPKTLPNSFPKGSKNDVPKNMRIFMDFCWIFVACCKSRTLKFMRPRSVLLGFHKNQMFAFGKHFGSEKPIKNHSKTRPELFHRFRKCTIYYYPVSIFSSFGLDFAALWASNLEPSPPRCLQRQAC